MLCFLHGTHFTPCARLALIVTTTFCVCMCACILTKTTQDTRVHITHLDMFIKWTWYKIM